MNKFKKSLNHIITHNHLPDYHLSIEEHNVIFTHEGNSIIKPQEEDTSNIQFKPQTIENGERGGKIRASPN